MLESILAFIPQIVGFFTQQFGGFGTFIAYFVLCMPIVTVLIEIVEFIVSLTPSKKDDEVVSKIHYYWGKILPVIELFPHANIPIAAGFTKAMGYVNKVGKSIIGAIRGWLT